MAGAGAEAQEAGAGEAQAPRPSCSIVVVVEQALADLLVVSYRARGRLYQGVLLDSGKRHLPYGVHSLNPAFLTQKIDPSDDKLHTVSQRFTYQESQYVKPLPAKSKPRAKQKMTVRLRPRKVLCSNCKGICNENSENVDTSRKRKLSERSLRGDGKTSGDEKSFLKNHSLIPKLSRLHPSEITSAINASGKDKPKPSKTSDTSVKAKSEDSACDNVTRELTFVDVSGEYGDHNKTESDEVINSTVNTFGTVFSSARTLKICFGAGEGTVVKIPAIVGDFNDDSGVSSDIGKSTKLVDAKAAKKALKRAKKQAKRNVTVVSSPRRTAIMMSPRHIGALSPRNNVSSNTPNVDTIQKRHRHKVKHKKKHRVDRKHGRDENATKNDAFGNDDSKDAEEHGQNHKLSINLKRLSTNSVKQSESGSESDGCDEGVPEFPTSSGGDTTAGGCCPVSPGDVVWGKVAGFPWWPGRVLSVTPTAQAHVAWYASTTSSLMPCNSLSPFLEDYKIRINKKKRGPYKEAVRMATEEARANEAHTQDPLANALAAPTQSTVSPRPVDVFS